MRARLGHTRVGAVILAAWGVLVGAAPHVLHHAGPFAGTALLAGAGGKLLFGAIGFVLSMPFLLRLHRRFHTLAAPALATAAFVAIFVVSTLVVGPLLSGSKGTPDKAPAGHASHHTK